MKAIFSLRRHSYLKTIGTFIIAAALIVGVVGCEGEGETYALAMAESPAGGGTATDVTGGSPYASGTVVDIQAVAAAGYEFDSWSAPAGNFTDPSAATTTFTMPAQDVTVTANFVLVYDLTMAVDPAGGGTATDATGTSPYPAATVVSIQAAPAAGYQFVMWTAPAGTFADANAATTTFTMPAEDVTATAHFVGPLDHFKCYSVGEAARLDIPVNLQDQFVDIDATVGSPWYFCNPTEKLHDDVTTPLANPDHHFMIYGIDYVEEPVTKYVEVDNQFGLEQLMVEGPIALAVPTQKGDHGAPLLLDHYLLYEVFGVSPVGELVILNDQFMSEPDAEVYEPVYLANPVQKTDAVGVTPVNDPDAHLLFYYIDVVGGFTTQVQVTNQFETGTSDVFDPAFLAVPSTKTELPPPLPLDHFKGYNLVEPVAAMPNEVYLEDQFSAFAAEATVAWEFFNPVEKNGEPLWYPDNHLMSFDIIHGEVFPNWFVVVDNQFGLQELILGSPVKLAVPTWKLDPGPHGPPMDLDHFLFYEVLDGLVLDIPVTLLDEFAYEENVVIEPRFFANPVQKTHGDVTPILNPWGHLVVYQITPVPYFVPVVADNQFATEVPLIAVESYYLAVPTEKWYYEEIPIG
jgi:hypothetical protein